MSVDDSHRKHRGGLCGGPERSACDPQTPPKTSQVKTKGKAKTGPIKKGRPTVVTVDENGCERKWGPLSQTSAWRAGSYWEDMDGDARVFIEKDREGKEMEVEMTLKKGRPKFTFKEKKSKKSQQPPEENDDDHITEEVVKGMSGDYPEERETGQKMWLIEEVASLDKEKEELKRTIDEMATRIERQETSKNELVEKLAAMETAITKIGEHVQVPSAFDGSAANSINCLEKQMRVHQDNFQEVARILQTHEQHIIYNGLPLRIWRSTQRACPRFGKESCVDWGQ